MGFWYFQQKQERKKFLRICVRESDCFTEIDLSPALCKKIGFYSFSIITEQKFPSFEILTLLFWHFLPQQSYSKFRCLVHLNNGNSSKKYIVPKLITPPLVHSNQLACIGPNINCHAIWCSKRPPHTKATFTTFVYSIFIKNFYQVNIENISTQILADEV